MSVHPQCQVLLNAMKQTKFEPDDASIAQFRVMADDRSRCKQTTCVTLSILSIQFITPSLAAAEAASTFNTLQALKISPFQEQQALSLPGSTTLYQRPLVLCLCLCFFTEEDGACAVLRRTMLSVGTWPSSQIWSLSLWAIDLLLKTSFQQVWKTAILHLGGCPRTQSSSKVTLAGLPLEVRANLLSCLELKQPQYTCQQLPRTLVDSYVVSAPQCVTGLQATQPAAISQLQRS